MKKEKELKYRYGKFAESMEPYYHQLDLRSFDDLDDEGFAFIMNKVKGVDMLDLNETFIGNKSIELLTRLEYVKEIRAKGCHELDNGCIADLNKLTSLEFLHVRFTAITIDGLLKLDKLDGLRTLMFSADDVPSIKEELLQLKTMLPQCELVIDAKPYSFRPIDLFIFRVKSKPYAYRLKLKHEPLADEWSNWLISPTDNYVEAEVQGPYPMGDIVWIEIDPIEKKQEGKLMPVKETDHTETVIELLEALKLPYMPEGNIIRIYL